MGDASFFTQIDIIALCSEHGFTSQPIYLDDDVNLTAWVAGTMFSTVCLWELVKRCIRRAQKPTLRELKNGHRGSLAKFE